MSNQYRRLKKLSIEEVFQAIDEERNFEFEGMRCSPLGSRVRMFRKYGVKCICEGCNLTGAFFAVERDKGNTGKYHLNLYAATKHGGEILMTADHRIPKFLGGANNIENLQPMCAPHNFAKGSKPIYIDGGVSKNGTEDLLAIALEEQIINENKDLDDWINWDKVVNGSREIEYLRHLYNQSPQDALERMLSDADKAPTGKTLFRTGCIGTDGRRYVNKGYYNRHDLASREYVLEWATNGSIRGVRLFFTDIVHDHVTHKEIPIDIAESIC